MKISNKVCLNNLHCHQLKLIKKMKLLKLSLFAILLCACVKTNAQNDTTPKWLMYQYAKKISFQTALLEVNNKQVAYNDLLKIPDSSVLKVEVYAKKAAQDIIGKDEGKNGLVMVTLHKKHFPYPTAAKTDTAYIIDDKGNKIFCKKAIPAMLGDTTNAAWIQFLQHSLKAQTPADNSSPAGLYNVDITFLVNKDGTVTDMEVLEDPGYGTAAEVRRLMATSPLWAPAMCDDTKVVFRQKERITFFVSEE